MLKYSDLTKGQKKTIDAYVAHRPELASAETLGSKDINIIWNELFALRAKGGVKVGYPNWLTRFNSIDRGNVSFPGPGSKGLSKTEVATLEKSKLQKILDSSEQDVVESISDDEFMAELKANGIEV
jgi:hypothetical protein